MAIEREALQLRLEHASFIARYTAPFVALASLGLYHLSTLIFGWIGIQTDSGLDRLNFWLITGAGLAFSVGALRCWGRRPYLAYVYAGLIVAVLAMARTAFFGAVDTEFVYPLFALLAYIVLPRLHARVAAVVIMTLAAVSFWRQGQVAAHWQDFLLELVLIGFLDVSWHRFTSFLESAMETMQTFRQSEDRLRSEHRSLVAAETNLEMQSYQLKAASRLNDVLMGAMQGPVMLVDSHGRIRMANAAAHTLFAYQPGTLAGVSVDELVPDDIRARHASLRAGFNADPHPRRMGARDVIGGVARDGSILELEIGLTPVSSDGERMTVVTLSDVSERARALRDMMDANRARTRFLAQISHEFRTPLNAIIGMGYLFTEEHPEFADDERLRTIVSASRLLGDLVNDILDFAKLEGDHLSLNPEPFDVVAMLDDVVAMLGTVARERDLYLRLECDGLRAAPWFSGDSSRLRQMLVNLVSNALKFTPEGGVVIRAFMVGQGDVAKLRFEVIDTGIGLTAEQRAKLFRPFVQADASVQGKYGGTGLGLALVNGLSDMMDGQCGVDSVPGEGSTFWFEAALPAALPPETQASLPVEEGGSLQGMRVLVVDDARVNLKVAAGILRREGFDVTTFDNAPDALEYLADADPQPDVVLMDMQMPGMDGLEATRRLRTMEQCHAALVLACTGNDLEENLDVAMDAGMDGFLQKPLDPALLRSILHERLAEKRGTNNA